MKVTGVSSLYSACCYSQRQRRDESLQRIATIPRTEFRYNGKISSSSETSDLCRSESSAALENKLDVLLCYLRFLCSMVVLFIWKICDTVHSKLKTYNNPIRRTLKIPYTFIHTSKLVLSNSQMYQYGRSKNSPTRRFVSTNTKFYLIFTVILSCLISGSDCQYDCIAGRCRVDAFEVDMTSWTCGLTTSEVHHGRYRRSEDYGDLDPDYQNDYGTGIRRGGARDPGVRIPISTDRIGGDSNPDFSDSGRYGVYGKKYVLPESRRRPGGGRNTPGVYQELPPTVQVKEVTCGPSYDLGGAVISRVEQICPQDLLDYAPLVRKM